VELPGGIQFFLFLPIWFLRKEIHTDRSDGRDEKRFLKSDIIISWKTI